MYEAPQEAESACLVARELRVVGLPPGRDLGMVVQGLDQLGERLRIKLSANPDCLYSLLFLFMGQVGRGSRCSVSVASPTQDALLPFLPLPLSPCLSPLPSLPFPLSPSISPLSSLFPLSISLSLLLLSFSLLSLSLLPSLSFPLSTSSLFLSLQNVESSTKVLKSGSNSRNRRRNRMGHTFRLVSTQG